MKLRRALIVPLLLALPVSAEMPKVVTVPFEMLQADKLISGHLAVQVRINGKGPYRLVFDTGAPVILLSTRVGKEAGLIGPKGNAKANGLLPGQVKVGKLEVGGVVAEDLQAMVFDHPTVKAIAEIFGPVDGIVGFPFFARYRTAIDYQAKEANLVIHPLMDAPVRVLVTQDGKPWIVLHAVGDNGEADFAQSPAFWRLIHERRNEQGIPWEEARKQLDLD